MRLSGLAVTAAVSFAAKIAQDAEVSKADPAGSRPSKPRGAERKQSSDTLAWTTTIGDTDNATQTWSEAKDWTAQPHQQGHGLAVGAPRRSTRAARGVTGSSAGRNGRARAARLNGSASGQQQLGC